MNTKNKIKIKIPKIFTREGDVFCQRSDGVRVESGCKSSVVGWDHHHHLASDMLIQCIHHSSYSSICFMLSCGPSCWSIAHASCSHGRCSCRPGYIPQVNTISTKTTLIIHHDNYHLFHHIIIIMSCCSTPPSPHPDYPVVQLEQPTRLFSHLMEGASKSTDIIQVKRKSQNNNFSNIFL